MKRSQAGIFITGTDTGVGKTYVAAGIARTLAGRGIDVGVMKPAETGCSRRKGSLFPADAAALIKAAGVRDRLSLVNPYRFPMPLAPSVAAGFERKRIEPGRLIEAFHVLARKHQFMIVEGAGGIMVPLTDRYCYLDLAGDLGLPVLIVARPGLGTINHTLLTVLALKKKRLRTAGIVINYADDGKTGAAERTNPGVIENMSGVGILGVIRHGAGNIEEIVEKIFRG